MTTIKLQETSYGNNMTYRFLNANKYPLSKSDFLTLKKEGFLMYYQNDFDEEYHDEFELSLLIGDKAYEKGYFMSKTSIPKIQSLGYNVEIDSLKDQETRKLKEIEERKKKAEEKERIKREKKDLIKTWGWNNEEYEFLPIDPFKLEENGFQVEIISDTIHFDRIETFWKVKFTSKEYGIFEGVKSYYNGVDMWVTNYKIPKTIYNQIRNNQIKEKSKTLFEIPRLELIRTILDIKENCLNYEENKGTNKYIQEDLFEFNESKIRDLNLQEKTIELFKKNTIEEYQKQLDKDESYKIYNGNWSWYNNEKMYEKLELKELFESMYQKYLSEKEEKKRIQKEKQEEEIRKRNLEYEEKIKNRNERRNSLIESIKRKTKAKLLEEYGTTFLRKSWTKTKILEEIAKHEINL